MYILTQTPASAQLYIYPSYKRNLYSHFRAELSKIIATRTIADVLVNALLVIDVDV